MASERVLSTDQIHEIVRGLYRTIGVRMEISPARLFPIVNPDAQHLCKTILRQMELPIGFRFVSNAQMHSTGLGASSQGGTSGITAQVQFSPTNLPLYGSEAMKDITVNVFVAPNNHYDAGQLAVVLSHEFSHIYLYSLRNPLQDNEYATDICSMLMGFSSCWKQYRKTKRIWTEGDKKHWESKAVGYLNDAEFSDAISMVEGIRKSFVQRHDRIKGLLAALNEENTRIDQASETMRFIISKLPNSETHGIESVAGEQRKVKEAANSIVAWLNSKRVYFEQDLSQLDSLLCQLDEMCNRLHKTNDFIQSKINIIKKNNPQAGQTLEETLTDIHDLKENIRISIGKINKHKRNILHLEYDLEHSLVFLRKHQRRRQKEKDSLSRIQQPDYIKQIDRRLEDIKQTSNNHVEFLNSNKRTSFEISTQLARIQQQLKEFETELTRIESELKYQLIVVKRNISLWGKILILCKQK